MPASKRHDSIKCHLLKGKDSFCWSDQSSWKCLRKRLVSPFVSFHISFSKHRSRDHHDWWMSQHRPSSFLFFIFIFMILERKEARQRSSRKRNIELERHLRESHSRNWAWDIGRTTTTTNFEDGQWCIRLTRTGTVRIRHSLRSHEIATQPSP